MDAGPRDSALVWPAPPDPARIRFLRSISAPRDVGVGRSVLRRIADVLAGSSERRIVQPSAVAVDSAGRIYVADVGARGVHVLDPAAGRYRFIARVGRTPLKWPVGLALGRNGSLFISDSENRAVFVVDASGRERARITTPLQRPTGIAFDERVGRLYVADTDGHRVRVFDAAGRHLFAFGERGTGDGQFNFPVHIAIAPDSTLLVTDALNARVASFRADGSFIHAFGRSGDAVGDMPRPKGTAFDSQGHVFVVEGLYDVVNVYDRAGRLLMSFGGPGRRAGEFWLATGIAIDAADRVYVTDSYNGRVQVFQYVRADD